jgi:hypothetical protein
MFKLHKVISLEQIRHQSFSTLQPPHNKGFLAFVYVAISKRYSHLSKVFGNVKNPYIINQNHILILLYYEVISGWILTNVTPRHLELSIF